MSVQGLGFAKVLARMVMLSAGLAMAQGAVAQERVMIVMDGSGSMWGQIDGVPKLSIARDTLRSVLPGVPETTELGLIAYGHREKGNCSDIELVVPAATGTASQISDAVDNMSFLGKTPLSAAVQVAADELRYTEDKATVILITDGIETCSADVCALGNLLEQRGVDFTAHVVGFGLSAEEGRQISCLADNTGGKFILADDGAALEVALNEVAVEVAPQLTFVAVDQDGNQVVVPMNWRVQASGGEVIAEASDKDRLIGEFEAGDYMVLVSGADVSGGMEFSLEGDEGNITLQVPVEVTLLRATLEAPESVAAGAVFEVVWTGPNDDRDYVSIVEVGAREGSFINYAYTGQGSPAEVTAPDGLGVYELRYVHGPSDKTLATAQINITEISGTLKAPKTVGAGSEFEVVWTGPDNERDFITIVEPDMPEGKFMSYAYTGQGSPAAITAPDEPGTYELRYVLNESDRTLVARTISVVAVEASLEAPASVGAGGKIEVEWTGPNNARDYITIVEVGADEGSYNSYAYTSTGSPLIITAPDGLGVYEIRYVMGQSDATLASREIELKEVSGSLRILNNPVPGGVIEVEWTGPNNARDYITIVEQGAREGAYEGYAYTERGSPAVFDVPSAPGAYEVRYVIDGSDRTLASLPITLAPASATLSAPSSVASGAVVQVKWSGPGNRNDYIEIVPVGAEADARPITEARAEQGTSLSLYAPDSAGLYEVRYKMRDTGEVLASVDLNVE